VARLAPDGVRRLTGFADAAGAARAILERPGTAALLNAFACAHLPPALDAAAPHLADFARLHEHPAHRGPTAPAWSHAVSYGALRWSLALAWDGQSAPRLTFRSSKTRDLSLSIADAAFLGVALDAVVLGLRRETAMGPLGEDPDGLGDGSDADAANCGQRWSAEEDALALDWWRRGRTLEEIALRLGRRASAVAKRLARGAR
jgi:hypothetical protein